MISTMATLADVCVSSASQLRRPALASALYRLTSFAEKNQAQCSVIRMKYTDHTKVGVSVCIFDATIDEPRTCSYNLTLLNQIFGWVYPHCHCIDLQTDARQA